MFTPPRLLMLAPLLLYATPLRYADVVFSDIPALLAAIFSLIFRHAADTLPCRFCLLFSRLRRHYADMFHDFTPFRRCHAAATPLRFTPLSADIAALYADAF